MCSPAGCPESYVSCSAIVPNDVGSGSGSAEECIPNHAVCNRERDCSNGYDEDFCIGQGKLTKLMTVDPQIFTATIFHLIIFHVV